jgi:MurNAc alpha-1-phosphate uridylyltransferase
MPVDAFILAAGRGERLRPLTDRTPKPLLEIAGTPIIARHLAALSRHGFSRVVVNVSWLGRQIVDALPALTPDGLRVLVSEELPEPLETAGGIVHALALIESDCFAVINGDVITDFDLSRLVPREDADAGLVMVTNPEHHPGGDFRLVGDRLLFPEGTNDTLTYAGIGWYRRSLFESMAADRRPLRPVLEDCLARGRLAGIHHHGYWIDIGTPERLQQARRHAATLNPGD